jgi:hypothetical protein
VCEHQGDLDGALATNQHALALARDAGMPSLVAGICGNLANVCLTRSDYDVAKRHLIESLEAGLASAELVLLRNGCVTAASLAMALEEEMRAAEFMGMAERLRAIHGAPYEPDNQPRIDEILRLLGDEVSRARAHYAGETPEVVVKGVVAWLRSA